MCAQTLPPALLQSCYFGCRGPHLLPLGAICLCAVEDAKLACHETEAGIIGPVICDVVCPHVWQRGSPLPTDLAWQPHAVR